MQHQEDDNYEDEVIGQSDDFSEMEEELAEAEIDDFAELDDLLRDSVKLANAKKSKAMGKRLTAEQEELLAAARIARESNLWTVQKEFIAVEDCYCPDCLGTQLTFLAYYQYKTGVKGGRIMEKVSELSNTVPCSTFYLPVKRSCALCAILKSNTLEKEVLTKDNEPAFDLLMALGKGN